MVKSKAFFFVSFEKLKLESPQSVVADVPDLASRTSASAALRPYLNAFPITERHRPGGARPNIARCSRIHRQPVPGARGWIRPIRAPPYCPLQSDAVEFGAPGLPDVYAEVILNQSSHSQLVTVGASHVFDENSINDFRVNYSKSNVSGHSGMDSYGGAVPLTDSLVFSAGVTAATGSFSLNVLGLAGYSYGGQSANGQQQVNVVDSFTKMVRNHHFKAGMDYREQLKTYHRNPYSVDVSFDGVTGNDESLLTGIALNGQVSSNLGVVYPTYKNLSLYGQDTWRATDRTTVTYGLRWDFNPAPTTRQGPKPFALSDSIIAGVTQNEPIYPTRWFDVAPRFGVAYLSDDTPGREMMLRWAWGCFTTWDMGWSMGRSTARLIRTSAQAPK